MINSDGSDPIVGRRILVVEDEVVLAMELETLLGEHGLEVIGPVHNVPDALRLIDTHEPEVACLDINLRGETSAPIAQRLKDLKIPFILLSGYGQRLEKDPAFLDVPLINKPHRTEDLIGRLNAIFT